VSITKAKAERIAAMFVDGQTIDQIAISGLAGGWTRAEAEQVAADAGWRIRRGRTHQPERPPVTRKAAPRVKGRRPVLQPRERPEQPWTIDEIANDLRVSPMTVYRLIHGGELRAMRVGRSFRVAADEYDRYLNNCSVDGVA